MTVRAGLIAIALLAALSAHPVRGQESGQEAPVEEEAPPPSEEEDEVMREMAAQRQQEERAERVPSPT